MKNVLVVRPGALGDAILTLPALAQLKRDGAETMTLLATPASWNFLPPLNSEFKVLDFGSTKWLALFSDAPLPDEIQTQLAAFDTAIVYLNAEGEGLCQRLREARIANVTRIDPPVAGMIGGVHAARWLCATASMGVDTLIDSWLCVANEPFDNVPYFVIHPGSGGRRKCWPPEKFIDLIRTLSSACGVPIVLFGEAETDLLESFRAQLDGIEWRAVVQRSLREVLGILHGARFFIGNDAGITHLAARVCPTLALFGPTSVEHWRPLGRAVKTVLAPDGELHKLTVHEVHTQLSEWLRALEVPA